MCMKKNLYFLIASKEDNWTHMFLFKVSHPKKFHEFNLAHFLIYYIEFHSDFKNVNKSMPYRTCFLAIGSRK